MAGPLKDNLSLIFLDHDGNFDDVFAYGTERHAARFWRKQVSELEEQQVCQCMLEQTELIGPEILAAKPRCMQAFKFMDEVLRLSSLTISLLIQVLRRILLDVRHQVHLLVTGIEMVQHGNDAPITAPLFATLSGPVKQFTKASGFTSGHTHQLFFSLIL